MKSQVRVNKNKIKKEAEKKPQFLFPSSIIKPISDFLTARLNSLKHTKKDIDKEDPFKDPDRLNDNASPDTDAAEQFGHAKTSAIKEELDKKMAQIKKAFSRIRKGKYGICEDCGQMIDTERLSVYPEVTLCVKCQAKREK